MTGIQLEIENGERSDNVDPYCEVIAKERKRKTFLRGRGVASSKVKSNQNNGGYIMDKEFFQTMKEEWTKELAPILELQILSKLQAANPQLNIVIPDVTSPPGSPNQVVGEQNLHSDVDIHPSPQVYINYMCIFSVYFCLLLSFLPFIIFSWSWLVCAHLLKCVEFVL